LLRGLQLRTRIGSLLLNDISADRSIRALDIRASESPGSTALLTCLESEPTSPSIGAVNNVNGALTTARSD